jgi:hypothetical protein
MSKPAISPLAYRMTWLWAQVWPVFLALGVYVALTAAGMAGAHALDLEQGILPAGSHEEARRWPGIWARWDSGYYLAIARSGYSAEGGTSTYYPLYPLLLRGVALTTAQNDVAMGTILSVTLTAAALTVLYHTLLPDHDRRIAGTAVGLLALFPMSLFLFAIYTESLFLLLSGLAYFLARRHRWGWAGLVCFLAGASRYNGFLVAGIPAVELLIQRGIGRKSLMQAAMLCLTGLLGFASYQAYQWIVFDDPLLSFHVQGGLQGRFVTWPWVSLWDTIQLAVFGKGVEGNWFWRLVGWEELAFTGLFILLAILAWGMLRRSLALYLSLSLLMYTASHGPSGMGLMSMPRYVLPLFPGFIVMALLLRDQRWRWLALVGSGILLIWYTFWFGSGRWVA